MERSGREGEEGEGREVGNRATDWLRLALSLYLKKLPHYIVK